MMGKFFLLHFLLLRLLRLFQLDNFICPRLAVNRPLPVCVVRLEGKFHKFRFHLLIGRGRARDGVIRKKASSITRRFGFVFGSVESLRKALSPRPHSIAELLALETVG